MKLIRLATLYFNTEEDSWLKQNWGIKIGNVCVKSQNIGSTPEIQSKQRKLVFASIDLPELPYKTANGQIIIPETERKLAELAIETVANVIAVAEKCRRSISSPLPCIALLPKDKEERLWLEKSAGILTDRSLTANTHLRLDINEDLLNSLSDRSDGVALLAEALAHNHATGKYREFIRLFECAFRLGISQLKKKLAQFLQGSQLGYDRNEITSWFVLRDGATHADGKKTSHLVLEADVSRFIPRMEQAAYDLLLNKKTWHDISKERRKIWQPNAAMVSDSKPDLQLIQGKPAAFTFQLLDAFQSYPLDLSASLDKLPGDLWSE